jgi:hypothetical protein
MRVDVTAEDIAKGVRSQCSDCPVALALKRALGDGISPVVGSDTVDLYFRASGMSYLRPLHIPLPMGTARRIQKFDRGEGMAPFSFEIDVPV